MTQKHLFSSFVLSVFLLLSIFTLQQALAEWTDPACPPPGCNSYPPITVGPTPQFKLGDLNITSETATGTLSSDRLYVRRATVLDTDGEDSLIVQRGNVGIGTVNPQGILDVRGNQDIFFKTGNRAGAVNFGANGGIVPVNVFGNVNVRSVPVESPTGNTYNNVGGDSSNYSVSYGGSPQFSWWQTAFPTEFPSSSSWNSVKITNARSNGTCEDSTMTTGECSGAYYDAAASAPIYAYDFFRLREENGSRYAIAYIKFEKRPTSYAGGDVNAVRGSFSQEVYGDKVRGRIGDFQTGEFETGIRIKNSDLQGFLLPNQRNVGLVLENRCEGCSAKIAFSTPHTSSVTGDEFYGWQVGGYQNSFEIEEIGERPGTSEKTHRVIGIDRSINTFGQYNLQIQLRASTTIAGRTVAPTFASNKFCFLSTGLGDPEDCITSWPTGGQVPPGNSNPPGNPGGSLDGSGATDRLAKWTGGSTLGASSVLDTNDMFRISHANVNIDNGLLVNRRDNANLRPGIPISDFEEGSLRFGGSLSGEGIYSNRVNGSVNQYGLSLMTLFRPRLVITNSGNVGIGIEDPQTKLHVAGSLSVQSTGNPGGPALIMNPGSGDLEIGSPTQDGDVYVKDIAGTRRIHLDGTSGRITADGLCLPGSNPSGGCITSWPGGGGGASNIESDPSETGYLKMGSITIQWGIVDNNGGSGENPRTVVYPRPLSQVFNAQCTVSIENNTSGGDATKDSWCQVKSLNPSSATFYIQRDSGTGRFDDIFWMVIGQE